MAESELQTTELHLLVHRIRQGDRQAKEDFVRRVGERIERLSRNMLRRYPNVRRWEETGDVFQQVLVNVLRSIETGINDPRSGREFYGYVSTCIRNTLLDLARHYRGVRAPEVGRDGNENSTTGLDPIANAAADDAAVELSRWCAFHEAVEQLPPLEREVVGLKFYHGWTNQQIGDLFGVTERMIRKHWQSACLRLNELLHGELPTL